MIRVLCSVWYIKYIKVQEVYSIHLLHFSQSHKYSVIGLSPNCHLNATTIYMTSSNQPYFQKGLFGIQAHPTTNSCRAYKIIINLNDIMYEPALT